MTVSFPCGPREQFLGPELRELARRGHRLTIVPLRPVGPAPADFPGEVLVAGLVDRRHISSAVRWFLRSPWRTLRALGSVVATRPRNAIRNLLAFPKACWVASAVAATGAEHVHGYWATTPASVALVVSRLTGVSWSFSVHRHDIAAGNALRTKTRSASFVRYPYELAGALVAAQSGSAPTTSVVVPLGVAVPPERVGPGRSIILCPAALTARKRQHDLLAAAASLTDVAWELELAGEGEDRPELQAAASQLGVSDRVRFLGVLPQAELHRRYASGEITAVALCSEDEGLPVSLVEAMAFGIPAVATDAGGTGELVDESTGRLVPVGDIAALTSALRAVLHDPDLATRLGRNARARVQAGYDVRSTTDTLEQAFSAAVARGRRP